MKRNCFFLFFFTVILTGFAFSQSNELIDTLLDEQSAGFGNTAYMVLSAASIIDESSTIQDAVDILSGDDWKNFEGKKTEDPVTLGEYSYMLMESFGIQGGIMYRLLPGPRYAVRELKYMGFVDDTDASKPVSGEEVIRILGYVLEWKEAGK